MSTRTTIRHLQKRAAEGQKFGMLTCYDATTAKWLVRAGGTSGEGEGIVALFRAGVAVWALILDWSEPFHSIALDGRIIKAVLGDYPTRRQWTIPIANPLSLELVTSG